MPVSYLGCGSRTSICRGLCWLSLRADAELSSRTELPQSLCLLIHDEVDAVPSHFFAVAELAVKR